MNCEAARKALSLYLYGELDFDQEEALEQHLDHCGECRDELEKERGLQHVMNRQDWQPSTELLQACRRDLHSRLGDAAAVSPSWKVRWRDFVRFTLPSPGLRRPLTALALVALGFFGAKAWDAARSGLEPSVLRVRGLTAHPSGGVRLVLEEVRQRTMTGDLDDAHIRQMLLAAASDPDDPGLRARTMEVLKDRGEQTDVRRALLRALQRDTNSGVRLKALEALKPFAGDPETRRVLSAVLLADDNPGVRTMAIDLLVENMQSEVIGALQESVVRESNPYIRQKSLRALREVNASVETF
ncbi:MAG TPA: HEAT repeat domain-containing protein [Bryobacteraceae bacterium]|nr:HEAT repeat domain-containing protein [Bryobacteraceae bacterium]